MSRTKVFIYGAGRAGRSLGRAIEASEDKKLRLSGAWNRTFARALASSRLLGVPVSAGDALPEDFQKSNIVLLSVPDDVIATVAATLVPHLSDRQILLHTSGSRPASVMNAPGMPAHLGCVHPLQALADDDGDPTILKGSVFAIEGDAQALDAARRIALAAHGQPVEIPSRAKVHYHAAAVVSANFLTVLMDAAVALLAEAKVDPATAIKMLLPLVRGTLDNLDTYADQGDGLAALSSALTGPVRRGDAGTLKAHRKAIGKMATKNTAQADLPDLYRLLAQRATAIAARGDLPPDRAQALLDVLESTSKP